MAEAIIRLTGSSSRIVKKPLPVDDPKVRQPDISRAVAHLEWLPKVGLETGLKRTIRWFQQQHEVVEFSGHHKKEFSGAPQFDTAVLSY